MQESIKEKEEGGREESTSTLEHAVSFPGGRHSWRLAGRPVCPWACCLRCLRENKFFVFFLKNLENLTIEYI